MRELSCDDLRFKARTQTPQTPLALQAHAAFVGSREYLRIGTRYLDQSI
jgi:hypothetical protein